MVDECEPVLQEGYRACASSTHETPSISASSLIAGAPYSLLVLGTNTSSLVTCPVLFTPSGRGTSPVATLSTSNPVKFCALDQKVEGTLDQGSWK